MEKFQRHIALEGKELSLGYRKGRISKEILSGLNFQLFSGEMTCLLGPNGVGKSTLIKAILGQIAPFSGNLSLEGKDIKTFSLESLAKQIAVVLTDPIFPGNMTVGQLVALGRTPHTGWSGRLNEQDRVLVEKALSDTKITYLQDERLSEISDGQRQKAMIARALAQDGQVLILDEPTAHLDLVNRFEIMSLLRDIAVNRGKGILVVTHDLDIAIETADRFWLLNCGTPLISGRPEDLILSGQVNQLLPSDKYRFNLIRGRIELEGDASEFWIEGPQELVFWVKKSLRKAGISEVQGQITIQHNPHFLTYSGQKFGTLEGLIQYLKT